MSRIGKKPVPIGAAKVSVTDRLVKVEGPKGKLELNVHPVITVKPPFDNTQTRRMMAGENPSAEQSAAMSVETHVSNKTPPTFLAQCVDDNISAIDNSLIMFSALRAAKAPVELHVFEQGGHSFNMGVPGGPTSGWPTLFANWAKSHGFFGGKAVAARAPQGD